MAYRLAGVGGDQPVSVVLEQGCNLVGSEPGVAVQLLEATVSRRHAEVVVSGEKVEVRDLESKNGTFVGSRRISHRRVYPGTIVSFGRVSLTLEEVNPGDLEVGMRFAEDPTPSTVTASAGAVDSTVGLRPLELFVTECLGGLLSRAEADEDEAALAEAGGRALFSALPTLRVEVTAKDDPEVVAFSAQQPALEVVAGARIEAESSTYRLCVDLPKAEMAEPYQPVVDAVATILRLASRQAPAPTPGSVEPVRVTPGLPEPPSVVPSMRQIYGEAARVAEGDVGVLVYGESGTGKEVLARFIHAASRRAEAAFVALNCAALPRDLLEAELFGVERGVATGVDPRPGKFELAHGGTLFLDEIGDMSIETQAKILRVLQEQEIFRLGGSTARPAACRIIAATNTDLAALRSEGRFREDLFYRIATWQVEIPALRHRAADIPNLASHFLVREAAKRGLKLRGISRHALQALTDYHWPGNIRQLENEMARVALFLPDGGILDSARLGAEVLAGPPASVETPLQEKLARVERREILLALEVTGGVLTEAAELLGIGRSTIYRRMNALGIESPQR